MALANKGVNVTKYDLGGTGDNIIPDGFIKSVEKVWLDTYVFTSAATIGTGMVIDIAKIPVGKKITGIEVYGIGSLSATSTNSIAIGARYGTTATTNGVQFLAATTYGTGYFVSAPVMANVGINIEVTGSTHTIFLQFLSASPSITGGTIATKVRYT